MVFSGLVTAWRLAGWPTRRSPSSVKATIEGVVRMPSAFSMTFGVLPSMTATHELVVPRSMPMTLPMVLPLKLRQAGRATWRPSEDVSGSSADPRSSPLDTRFAAFSRLTGSYRRGPGGPQVSRSRNREVPGATRHQWLSGHCRIAAGRLGRPSVQHLLESPRACSADFLFTSSRPGPVWQVSPPPRAAEPIFPPGLRIGLEPPGGHETEHPFPGFRGQRTQGRHRNSRSAGQRVSRA